MDAMRFSRESGGIFSRVHYIFFLLGENIFVSSFYVFFFCCIFSETRYDGEMISKRRIYQEFQTEEGNGVEGGGGGS